MPLDLKSAEGLLEKQEAEKKAIGIEFEPTDEQRQMVSQMATAGIPQDIMCLMIRWPDGQPTSWKTLKRHFERELYEGVTQANIQVAGSLYKLALAGNVGAQAFWLKSRAGWRETERTVAVTGADGKPLQVASGVMVIPGIIEPELWEQQVEQQQQALLARAGEIVGEAHEVSEKPEAD